MIITSELISQQKKIDGQLKCLEKYRKIYNFFNIEKYITLPIKKNNLIIVK